MKYFIKSVAFKQPFEFECEFSIIPNGESAARLKVWFGNTRECWKENTILCDADNLKSIVEILEHADDFRIDNLPECPCGVDNELEDRGKMYVESYKYYVEKFLPIESKFFG